MEIWEIIVLLKKDQVWFKKVVGIELWGFKLREKVFHGTFKLNGMSICSITPPDTLIQYSVLSVTKRWVKLLK